MSEQAIELEVDRLNRLLYTVESSDNLCVSCEVIDLNRRKIFQDHKHIEGVLKDKNRKPFIFINTLN